MESHEAGFPPFPHSLEIPSGFPHSHGLDDWIYVFSCPLNSNHRHRKGLVTDVSGPQRNACPGTLTGLDPCCIVDPFRIRWHEPGSSRVNATLDLLRRNTRLKCPQSPTLNRTKECQTQRLVYDDRRKAPRLWRPFGEVQQDLLLSCLTIGQAYCLLEVFKWISQNRWRRE